MILSPDQAAAVDRIMSWLGGPEQRLTFGGYAGTGKTTVISYLLSHLRMQIAVCAFTGKAAAVLRSKGVPASTMHRLIYQPQARCEVHHVFADENNVCPVCDSADNVQVQFFRVPEIAANLVIVDEASMLNERLVRDLESFGTQVLYVGDHGQLEPIGDDPGLMHDPQIRLEQIHRQAEGSAIIRFAHAVRRGHEPAPGIFAEADGVVVRRGLRNIELAEYDAVLCGYNKTRVAVNMRIRERRGFSGDPCVGERLICLQNDSDLGVFNGLLVTVLSVRKPRTNLVMDLEDDFGQTYLNIKVSPDQFNQEKRPDRYPRGIGCFDFGYALTTHKAQGSEWKRVAVLEQIARSWTPSRWRYTAATRASETLHYFLPG